MRKYFTALAGACVAVACTSGAWAQTSDSESGAQPQKHYVQRARKAPVAYGFISFDGTVNSGTGNFTVKFKSNVYEITISGVDYAFSSFATIVTPLDGGYCTTGSGGGKLDIQCFDTTGNPQSARFAFATY